MALSLTQAFGLAVQEVRTARGLSQDHVALEGDIDRTYVGEVENALKSPTLRTIEKLARVLEVRPSQLVVRAEQILDEERQAGA